MEKSEFIEEFEKYIKKHKKDGLVIQLYHEIQQELENEKLEKEIIVEIR